MTPPTIKKPPVVVGAPIDLRKDPHLAKVRQGIDERMEQVRAARPKMGNLAEANEAYKPGKDGPMTIAQVVESQKAVEAAGADRSGLSTASMEGLKAVAAASQAARDKMQPRTPPAAPAKKETRMTDAAPVPEKPEKTVDAATQKEAERKLRTQLDDLDDLDVERIMRGIQNDVINNEREREAVKKRCSEIDFAAGIGSNEFTQDVDIVPGKEGEPSRLKVTFRTITPMENQGIRLWLIERATSDPRFDKLAGEIYGLALVVASIVKVGGKQFPGHLMGQAPTQEFDTEAFVVKYQQFIQMPMPLIHALGTHSQWFDIRVREMFTTDYAKNG